MESNIDKYITWVPPGHPYSPIPNSIGVQEKRDSVFHLNEHMYGISMDANDQLKFLTTIRNILEKSPFSDEPQNGYRYFYNNPMFGHADGLALYGIMKYIKPRSIIEIGTGFSTALMLDVNSKEFNGDINISCIESFKGSISPQLRQEKSLKIYDEDLYDIDLEVFKSLKPNDILFVDSSHVSKVGSDVNYIIHTILPNLEAGVYIHFHDIMANFEYPLEWVREGRAWNEAYVLRAFLMFNDVFNIFLFNSYLGHFHKEWLRLNAPQFMRNAGGSLWIKKDK